MMHQCRPINRKYKVTMTTLCGEIEARIATSFNRFIQCDFQGNQADFHDINNYSKGNCQQFSIYLPNSKNYTVQNTFKLHTRPK